MREAGCPARCCSGGTRRARARSWPRWAHCSAGWPHRPAGRTSPPTPRERCWTCSGDSPTSAREGGRCRKAAAPSSSWRRTTSTGICTTPLWRAHRWPGSWASRYGTWDGSSSRPEGLRHGTAHHGTALTGAHRQRTGPGARQTTIADVAHRWGFSGQAHFARLFRSRIGLTPSEARAEAMTPTPPSRPPGTL
ncbi:MULTISPECIES: helix-turn-helix domain-containing protein [Streptomyces]|uniref:helix-turn-helix domain-containing protein n=1 Tax=Streptomyces TaxID=1883 RepID=UPI00211C82E3|nr:helix-turn-helix domain-containing protein [Streptomyces sp. 1222.2]